MSDGFVRMWVWNVRVPVGIGVRIKVAASAVKNEGNVLAFSVGFGVLVGAVSHNVLKVDFWMCGEDRIRSRGNGTGNYLLPGRVIRRDSLSFKSKAIINIISRYMYSWCQKKLHLSSKVKNIWHIL